MAWSSFTSVSPAPGPAWPTSRTSAACCSAGCSSAIGAGSHPSGAARRGRGTSEPRRGAASTPEADALGLGAEHGVAGLAPVDLAEGGQVGQRAVRPPLAGCLQCGACTLFGHGRRDLLAPQAGPCTEERLAGLLRGLRLRLREGVPCDLDGGEVGGILVAGQAGVELAPGQARIVVVAVLCGEGVQAV